LEFQWKYISLDDDREILSNATTDLINPDWPMIACSLPDITDPWWTSFEWFGSTAVFSCTLPSTV
jgi:hypothetical protein